MVHRAKFGIERTVWSLGAAAALLAGTAVMYATPRGKREASTQEREAPRETAGGPSTTLNDQTDLWFATFATFHFRAAFFT